MVSLRGVLLVFVLLCFVTVSGFANGLFVWEEGSLDVPHSLGLLLISYASILGGFHLVSEGYAPFGYYCLSCGVVLFAHFVVEAGRLVEDSQPQGLDEYFGVRLEVKF